MMKRVFTAAVAAVAFAFLVGCYAASEPFPADFVETNPYQWNGLTNTYKAQTSAWLWSASAAAEIYDAKLKALCVNTSATPLAPSLTLRPTSFGLPLRCLKDL